MRLRLPPARTLAVLLVASLCGPTSVAYGESINHIYDDLNRLVRTEYGDGRVLQYTYDEVGNRQTRSVQQGACVYVLSDASVEFSKAGGTGTLNITAGESCPWTVASDESWITITSGNGGTGNGTITFSVPPYTGGATRPGTISVAGTSFVATQIGASLLGVFRGGNWYLDANGNGAWDIGVDTVYASFGMATDKPVTGDWNGDGKTEVGTFRGGAWYLDADGSGTWNSGADTVIAVFGLAGDVPVTGDWNGDGKSEIGTHRNRTWYLDQDGNGLWNAGSDLAISFGAVGDSPVPGKW